MARLRFPVQALPMMFISAVLATCAGDNEEIAQADQAPVATNNVAQVNVVEVTAQGTQVPPKQNMNIN